MPTIKDVESAMTAWLADTTSSYRRRVAQVTCDEYFVTSDKSLDQIHVATARGFGYTIERDEHGVNHLAHPAHPYDVLTF